jgi:hypothetical protein
MKHVVVAVSVCILVLTLTIVLAQVERRVYIPLATDEKATTLPIRTRTIHHPSPTPTP